MKRKLLLPAFGEVAKTTEISGDILIFNKADTLLLHKAEKMSDAIIQTSFQIIQENI